MFFWLCVLLMTKEPAVIVVAGYYMVLAFKVFFAGKTAITNRIRTLFWDSRIRVLLGGIVVYILYAVYQGSLFAWAGQTKIADTLKSAKNGSVKTNYFGVEWKYMCTQTDLFVKFHMAVGRSRRMSEPVFMEKKNKDKAE